MINILLFLVVIVISPFFLSSEVFAQNDLPALPVLPSLEIYGQSNSDDVFAPSQSPSPTITKPVNYQINKNTENQSSTTTKHTSAEPLPNSVQGINKNTSYNNKSSSVSSQTSYYKNNLNNSVFLNKGKKFKVRLSQTISSDTPAGTRISFRSIYPETFTYITIPAGTIFKGWIKDSHAPQLAGNGGLIVIEVDQMQYKGKTYEIDAKVSVANDKRIFFNNIKGKRTYLSSLPKTMKTGSKFFKKMWKSTKNLAKNQNGVEIILTPVTFAAGSVVYVTNLVASPFLALFYKGQSITIPAESKFTIQLRENIYILK